MVVDENLKILFLSRDKKLLILANSGGPQIGGFDLLELKVNLSPERLTRLLSSAAIDTRNPINMGSLLDKQTVNLIDESVRI